MTYKEEKMAQSYEKECDGCGEILRITESHSGWLIYEVATDSPHSCGQGKVLIHDGGPLTVRTYCWFCDSIVFFHRTERGGIVLFDSLGKPWPIHPCWKKNVQHRNTYIEKLFKTLGSRNLSRKGEYDFISEGIRISKPAVTIHMKSNDHKALDSAVSMVVNILSVYDFPHIKVIPLLKQEQNVDGENMMFHHREIHIEQPFASLALKKWKLVFLKLRNADLPRVVTVSVESV